MSGIILYLAIVAIWVCVLVPRWVRRTHSAVYDVRDATGAGEAAGAGDAAGVGDAAGDAAGVGDDRAEPQADARTDLTATEMPAIVRRPLTRPRILQARRRLLTMLLTVAAAAAACTAAGLAQWWICVPPAAMLAMYVPLLRVAAVADAEIQRGRQEAAVLTRAARQRARAAWAARVPEPTAEIIDISGRVGDQLYDQYADATMRAVGD